MSSHSIKNKFCCPFCQERLWRIGSRKYQLLFPGKSNKNCFNYDKKLSVLPKAYLNKNTWIEEFFCQKHGKMWMLVLEAHGNLTVVPALAQDWSCTAPPINPNLSDASLTEYRCEMSSTNGQRIVNTNDG